MNEEDDKNALYIRTTKTASSYLVETLLDKNRNIALTDCRKYLTGPENKKTLNTYKNTFWFTSVRNPYLRAISCYKYGQTRKNWFDPKLTFEEYLEIDFTTVRDDYVATHNAPISFYLRTVLKEIKYFIRVEDLHNSIQQLCKIIGISNFTPPSKIVYETKYDKTEIPSLLTKDAKELVYKRYEEDFDNFKYLK